MVFLSAPKLEAARACGINVEWTKIWVVRSIRTLLWNWRIGSHRTDELCECLDG